MHEEIEAAIKEAGSRADALGEPFCVVSGRKRGRLVYRVYPVSGFGLPAGGRLEEVVEPARERIRPEPPEKISSNGF